MFDRSGRGDRHGITQRSHAVDSHVTSGSDQGHVTGAASTEVLKRVLRHRAARGDPNTAGQSVNIVDRKRVSLVQVDVSGVRAVDVPVRSNASIDRKQLASADVTGRLDTQLVGRRDQAVVVKISHVLAVDRGQGQDHIVVSGDRIDFKVTASTNRDRHVVLFVTAGVAGNNVRSNRVGIRGQGDRTVNGRHVVEVHPVALHDHNVTVSGARGVQRNSSGLKSNVGKPARRVNADLVLSNQRHHFANHIGGRVVGRIADRTGSRGQGHIAGSRPSVHHTHGDVTGDGRQGDVIGIRIGQARNVGRHNPSTRNDRDRTVESVNVGQGHGIGLGDHDVARVRGRVRRQVGDRSLESVRPANLAVGNQNRGLSSDVNTNVSTSSEVVQYAGNIPVNRPAGRVSYRARKPRIGKTVNKDVVPVGQVTIALAGAQRDAALDAVNSVNGRLTSGHAHTVAGIFTDRTASRGNRDRTDRGNVVDTVGVHNISQTSDHVHILNIGGRNNGDQPAGGKHRVPGPGLSASVTSLDVEVTSDVTTAGDRDVTGRGVQPRLVSTSLTVVVVAGHNVRGQGQVPASRQHDRAVRGIHTAVRDRQLVTVADVDPTGPRNARIKASGVDLEFFDRSTDAGNSSQRNGPAKNVVTRPRNRRVNPIGIGDRTNTGQRHVTTVRGRGNQTNRKVTGHIVDRDVKTKSGSIQNRSRVHIQRTVELADALARGRQVDRRAGNIRGRVRRSGVFHRAGGRQGHDVIGRVRTDRTQQQVMPGTGLVVGDVTVARGHRGHGHISVSRVVKVDLAAGGVSRDRGHLVQLDGVGPTDTGHGVKINSVGDDVRGARAVVVNVTDRVDRHIVLVSIKSADRDVPGSRRVKQDVPVAARSDQGRKQVTAISTDVDVTVSGYRAGHRQVRAARLVKGDVRVHTRGLEALQDHGASGKIVVNVDAFTTGHTSCVSINIGRGKLKSGRVADTVDSVQIHSQSSYLTRTVDRVGTADGDLVGSSTRTGRAGQDDLAVAARLSADHNVVRAARGHSTGYGQRALRALKRNRTVSGRDSRETDVTGAHNRVAGVIERDRARAAGRHRGHRYVSGKEAVDVDVTRRTVRTQRRSGDLQVNIRGRTDTDRSVQVNGHTDNVQRHGVTSSSVVDSAGEGRQGDVAGAGVHADNIKVVIGVVAVDLGEVDVAVVGGGLEGAGLDVDGTAGADTGGLADGHLDGGENHNATVDIKCPVVDGFLDVAVDGCERDGGVIGAVDEADGHVAGDFSEVDVAKGSRVDGCRATVDLEGASERGFGCQHRVKRLSNRTPGRKQINCLCSNFRSSISNAINFQDVPGSGGEGGNAALRGGDRAAGFVKDLLGDGDRAVRVIEQYVVVSGDSDQACVCIDHAHALVLQSDRCTDNGIDLHIVVVTAAQVVRNQVDVGAIACENP